MANLGQNICNMITCRESEHCLFRSFGLGGRVDSARPLTRGILQAEVSRWYPATVVKSVEPEQISADGTYIYRVSVEGR